MNTAILKKEKRIVFDEQSVLHKLKHFLPAQAPLKDFIHHNTLHAFQEKKFYEALKDASAIFGYKVTISLSEFRQLHRDGKINKEVLDRIIVQRKGEAAKDEWKYKTLIQEYDSSVYPRVGLLRDRWKSDYSIDLGVAIQPILFRILCSYLDQGISIWNFPVWHLGFLESVREIERNSFNSFFKSERVRKMLIGNGKMDEKCNITDLLHILVGDESLYEQYLFDQQFAHQGWSGMVSTIEDMPESLLDQRKISVHDLIVFELLLEIDALDRKFGEGWSPLGSRIKERPVELFDPVSSSELNQVIEIWQDAFEWSYYDQVLAGIGMEDLEKKHIRDKSFQAVFCIDDREFSLRRYLEQIDVKCGTYATPGFFGVEFYFQPEHGKSYTKQCPAPVTPKFLVKEIEKSGKRDVDLHFNKHTHSLVRGWVIAQTLGFWSALRLFMNIFRPSLGPAVAYSFRHMDKVSKLSILNKSKDDIENNLQIGFTIEEMVVRVENVLKSIGMVNDFAPVVYMVGHGSSSVNNPHYAAYDCGACSGRPGSVNARVFCYMANHPEVREMLKKNGIAIPETTRFVGALHDTTRDEIVYYDEHSLTHDNLKRHLENEKVFKKALDLNAKERSRRFESIDTKSSPEKIHKKVLRRSVSLFEPRPELNHATNALCIVGRRKISMGLYLDRRAFTNSYDYEIDPEGKYLFNILKAAAPVCGGINLEYFFSRVDNQKLGAGTKLPHNVMGLFGVANGIDGDLRPGLPLQMIEVHDPIRLMIIVEHFPDVVLKTIQQSTETYEWFINEWVHLIVLDPVTRELWHFKDGVFKLYKPAIDKVGVISEITPVIESSQDNLPVYVIEK